MLFQELGKLKRASIMTSIIWMAVGVLMIICPEQYITSLVEVLGYGLLIFAVVMVLDFISSKRVLMNYIYLTGAMIIGLLGTVVLVDENVVRGIGLIFGLLLLVDGGTSMLITRLYVKRSQRKGWQSMVVLSALLILFGLIVLVNPWKDRIMTLFDIIGCMLLFSSVVSIIRLIYIWPIKGEQEG